MKGNCRVSRNEQTCVSGQRYDSTLQRVRKHIFSQNGVAPRIIRPRQYFIILPGLFVFQGVVFSAKVNGNNRNRKGKKRYGKQSLMPLTLQVPLKQTALRIMKK